MIVPGESVTNQQDITPVEFNTTLNSTGQSDAVPLPAGWLTSVTVVIPAAVTATVPRGAGIYLQVVVFQSDPSQSPNQRAVVWAGNVRFGQTRASVPNLRIEQGAVVQVYWWQASTPAGGQRIRVCFGMETNPPSGGTDLWSEDPLDGPPVVRSITLAAPAAGADFADVTVPAKCRWRVPAVNGRLNSAGAARGFRIEYRNAAGDIKASSSPGITQAVAVVTYSGFIGAGQPAAVPSVTVPTCFALPECFLDEGDVVHFVTAAIGGADQWDLGVLMVEECVRP